MSRPGWQALMIARQTRKIEVLEQEKRCLERRICALKQIIQDMCDISDLEPPDLRYQRYVPQSRAKKDEESSLDDMDPQDLNIRELREELLMNTCRAFRRYSENAKRFYSTIYLLSPSAYEGLNRVLPCPSSKTLYRYTWEPLKKLRQSLEDITQVQATFEDLKKQWGDSCLVGTLSIDACSHSSYLPQSTDTSPLADACHLDEFLQHFGQIPDTRKVNSYCFTFYYQPLDPRAPCTAVYVITEPSGKAQDYHVETLHKIEEIAKCQGFRIVMLCSDGDNTYYKQTSESYTTLKRDYPGIFENWNCLKDLGSNILDGKTSLFGADMLHLLKNIRTRILEGYVAMNVTEPRVLDMRALRQLPVAPECFVNSDLNKMVDSLPIQIFTFGNSKWLLDRGYWQEAIFILIFALFHGFFRAECSMADRIEIGMTFLQIARMYIDYITEMSREHKCHCLEYRRRRAVVTMFPQRQLERMAVTTAVGLSVLISAPDERLIGMDRMSTHPLENFFGLLRVLCKFRHSYENIVDKIAKTHYIREARHRLQITQAISKRVNVAGQRVLTKDRPNSDRELQLTSVSIMTCIDCPYMRRKYSELPYEEHMSIVKRLVDRLAKLNIPVTSMSGEYSGQQILSRLITNSRKEMKVESGVHGSNPA